MKKINDKIEVDEVHHNKSIIFSLVMKEISIIAYRETAFYNDDVKSFVFYYEKRPAGVGTYHINKGTAEILFVGVRKQLRSKGIGKAIVSYLEKIIKNNKEVIDIVKTVGIDKFKLISILIKQNYKMRYIDIFFQIGSSVCYEFVKKVK
ncbi:Acetyltransferase GNAT family protein [Spraguea lophii 42_110]|uniref:Acetyltransferase GNAT family protein n=1 Tax=Spraguea lophii (strain 42_110) TaxID=1358809 RepID=S7W8J2_SPRLO|nr:Acetyltransferase GNAT family protein [Spraguea lophii 42_110]